MDVSQEKLMKEKLPQIVEYFVDFYGDEYRPIIEEQLCNRTIYAFIDIDNNLNESLNQKKTMAVELFHEKICTAFNTILRPLKTQDNFIIKNLPNLAQWSVKIPDDQLSDALDFIRCYLLESLYINNVEDFKNALETDGEKIYNFFKVANDEYEKNFKSTFEEIKETELKNRNLEKVKLAENQFLEKWQEKISVSLIKTLKIEMNEENLTKLNNLTPIILDNFLKKEEFISTYDRERYREVLADVYNMAGIQKRDLSGLGQALKVSAMQSMLNKAILPLREELVKDKKSLDKSITRYIDETSNDIKELYEMMDKDVYDSDNLKVNIEIFKKHKNKIQGLTIYSVNNNDYSKNINVCCCNSLDKMSDLTLIHEMGHCVSAQTFLKEGVVCCKSGVVADFGLQSQSKTWEKYNLLNEVINEYFAVSIHQNMQKDNFQIAGNKKNKGISTYTLAFDLVKDFIEEHKKELIECIFSPDPEKINDTFGEENFENLASLVDDEINFIVRNEMKFKFIEQEIIIKEGDNPDLFNLQSDPTFWSNEAKEYLEFYKRADKIFKDIDEFQNNKDNELE